MKIFITLILSLFFTLSLTVVFAQDPAAKLLSADTIPLLHLYENNLMKPSSAEVIYTISGNIIFSGASDKRKDIEILIGFTEFSPKKPSYIYGKNSRSIKYSYFDYALYLNQHSDNPDALLLGIAEAGAGKIHFLNADSSVAGVLIADKPEVALVIASAYFLIQHNDIEKQVASKLNESAVDAARHQGTIRPYWGRLNDEWIWDGSILKPRFGNRAEDIWYFDGQRIYPVYFPSPYDEWVWDGEILKPYQELGSDYAINWDGKTLKPYWVSDLQREYVFKDNMVRPAWGNNPDREWLIQGKIPLPVIAFVIYGMADR